MKVGDKLYFPGSRRYGNEIWATITSIGRKYIYTDKPWNGRIHKTSLCGKRSSAFVNYIISSPVTSALGFINLIISPPSRSRRRSGQ